MSPTSDPGPPGAITRERPGTAGDGARTRLAAIEVDGLEKAFRIPRFQVHTLKERALHPLRRAEHDELRVLAGVSFDVQQGEFFGIVGRNGSGKSTLLKCLAGIYRADGGSIRIAGRLSPFIELGVGFNPDLTARDNVVINAVMLGLTPRAARARIGEILSFAELEQFEDMKLKNYSSGMQVRLAFAVMVQTDSDVLLIDEVLAVGDAAFQQKCFDAFHRLRVEGRTIVLVTHDMETVERFCDRALLLEAGQIDLMGDPREVGQRYIERNFQSMQEGPGPVREATARERARITDVWLENDEGERTGSAEHGRRLHLRALIEVLGPVEQPVVDFWLDDDDDVRIFATSTRPWPESAPLAAGDALLVEVEAENPLAPGRYHIGCSLLSGRAALDVVALENRARALMVYGPSHVYGSVALEHDLRLHRQRGGVRP